MRPDRGRVVAHALEVVKIGGSLLADAPRLTATLRTFAEDTRIARVIVPGGGPFADAVRSVQRALDIDDWLAHRLALDAMCSMAQVLHAIEPRIPLLSAIDEIPAAIERRGTVFWSPDDIRDGHPEIRENWDVTSDSLALWLATLLQAESCILMKSVDAPENSAPDAMSRVGLVDRAFPGFAGRFGGGIVLRGPTRDVALARLEPHREAAV